MERVKPEGESRPPSDISWLEEEPIYFSVES